MTTINDRAKALTREEIKTIQHGWNTDGRKNDFNKLCRMALAYLDLQGRVVPEGWKLVPIEPTFGKHRGTMSHAGAEVLPMVEGIFGNAGAIACAVYRAMIEAAPPPHQQQEKDGSDEAY